MINRYLDLIKTRKSSFFLWGPRQVGKTSYLKTTFPDAIYIDLLNSSEFMKYIQNPNIIEQELRLTGKNKLIIIDEVQKVPLLLDEVHRLIEQYKWTFGLCGSSARKLKRGQANLLGGRALRYEMFGLTIKELKQQANIVALCNRGNVPNHYLSENYWNYLESYVNDYLKEEILAEALVRNLPSFSDFLRASALSDTEVVDYTNIASDCGVRSPTVKNYYEILCDTLQGFFLPSYSRRPKRKIIHAPKFYYANVGVVNWLAKRKEIEPSSEAFGKAYENVIINEIRAWNSYKKMGYQLSYWKLASGAEVDLVIEELSLAIEIKSSKSISAKSLKGLRELSLEHPKFTKKIIVSLEQKSRITDDGIRVYSLNDFISLLWESDLKI